jgi:hypothetical protein
MKELGNYNIGIGDEGNGFSIADDIRIILKDF